MVTQFFEPGGTLITIEDPVKDTTLFVQAMMGSEQTAFIADIAKAVPRPSHERRVP